MQDQHWWKKQIRQEVKISPKFFLPLLTPKKIFNKAEGFFWNQTNFIVNLCNTKLSDFLFPSDGGRYGDRYRRDRDYEERDRRRDEDRSTREAVRKT